MYRETALREENKLNLEILGHPKRQHHHLFQQAFGIGESGYVLPPHSRARFKNVPLQNGRQFSIGPLVSSFPIRHPFRPLRLLGQCKLLTNVTKPLS